MNKIIRARTTDGLTTYDRRTIDATGAFLIGELERLDPTIHDPLYSVTWSRDIDLREHVTIGDESSSFTNSTFAAAGGVGGPSQSSSYGNYGGKSFIGKDSTAITAVALDIGKTAQPLYLWGMELSYTIPELESAQRLGRPVDQQKFDAIKIKHQMDIDEMVYVGDASISKTGLINSAAVTATNVVADSNSHTTWAQKLTDDSTGSVGPPTSRNWSSAWRRRRPISQTVLPRRRRAIGATPAPWWRRTSGWLRSWRCWATALRLTSWG